MIDTIQESHLSPEDLYRLKEETSWEDSKNASFREGKQEGEAKGRAEGKAEGLLEGRTEGLRQAITDLCDVLGVELGADRREHLAGLGAEELDALREDIKQSKGWPR
ncbi:MAG: hypothetical protein R3F14_39695 [Polyangiaceae bacterium]